MSARSKVYAVLRNTINHVGARISLKAGICGEKSKQVFFSLATRQDLVN